MAKSKPVKAKPKKDVTKLKCGIVMPISAIDGCSESHWGDVLDIISDAIVESGYAPHLVSDSEDIGIIQGRIIQNLYDNPIVVCDISGKNPNVMFELGMRLAFDKPTIIIKDDKTPFSFDTSPIEHLEYPRDLRFTQIIEFTNSLVDKIKGTISKSQSDPNYSPFLKHFGKFVISKVDSKELSSNDYIYEEIKAIRNSLTEIQQNSQKYSLKNSFRKQFVICTHRADESLMVDILNKLRKHGDFIAQERGKRHYHFQSSSEKLEWNKLLQVVKVLDPTARLLPSK